MPTMSRSATRPLAQTRDQRARARASRRYRTRSEDHAPTVPSRAFLLTRRGLRLRPRGHGRAHHALGIDQGTLTIARGGREIRKLHEIALLQERRDLREREPKVRHTSQGREGLVGSRLQTVEAEACAEILPNGIVYS